MALDDAFSSQGDFARFGLDLFDDDRADAHTDLADLFTVFLINDASVTDIAFEQLDGSETPIKGFTYQVANGFDACAEAEVDVEIAGSTGVFFGASHGEILEGSAEEEDIRALAGAGQCCQVYVKNEWPFEYLPVINKTPICQDIRANSVQIQLF